MTDFDSDPLDPLDELASAALDGVADAGHDDLSLDAETSQVLADRVVQLGRVRDLLADPVTPPSDDVRDRMIARAISVGTASADDAAAVRAATDQRTVVTSVSSLDRHRSRRTTRLRQFAPLAVAAVVLLLVAIITPALIDSGGDDVASSFTEPSSDAAGGEMGDTGGDQGTESFSEQALSPDDADTAAAAMEEDMADEAEASSGAESGAALVVPGPSTAETEGGDGSASEELSDGEVSDKELLDAMIRYRALESANTLRSTTDDSVCTDVVNHPIGLVVTGSYRSQPAIFFAQIDGSAVLAVTVVSPACEVMAEVTSD